MVNIFSCVCLFFMVTQISVKDFLFFSFFSPNLSYILFQINQTKGSAFFLPSADMRFFASFQYFSAEDESASGNCNFSKYLLQWCIVDIICTVLHVKFHLIDYHNTELPQKFSSAPVENTKDSIPESCFCFTDRWLCQIK